MSQRTSQQQDAEEVFFHPSSLVEGRVGRGTRVWAFAHVMEGALVGVGCNLGECTFVESGATVGDFVTVKNGVQLWHGVTCDDWVFIGPNATFTNDVRPRAAQRKRPALLATTRVGRGASIGANATVVAGNSIGAYAMVGAGAVVTKDVPCHALVVGNPAHQVGWVCRCGEDLDDALSCPHCGSAFVPTEAGLTIRNIAE